MNTTHPTTAFKSYKVSTAASKYLVINEGVSKVTGEKMLKVRPMRYVGFAGDHSPKVQYSYGNPIWIKASLVVMA